ncbi:hypothetical protein GTR04_6995 [Trichophyton interdigitale]|nr:hypothetical protein GY631_7024 [Trichophyton interdigitale]KAG5217125.1 hypothetical protein GY632_6870 [Trichophyton interdigitale]KAG8205621.1 hypothetical protein GTR04_6995 [Trichophyton interdigitale]
MKLPPLTKEQLQAREYITSAPASPQCNCLSNGAVAGIVLGSVAGVVLLLWLLRCAVASTRVSPREPTMTTTTTYHHRPSRSYSHSHSGSYRSSGGSRSRSRRGLSYYGGGRYIERPSKVYVG